MKKPNEIQKSHIAIADTINESNKEDDEFDLLDFMQRSVSVAGVKETNVSSSFILNGKKEDGKIKFVYGKDNSGIVYGFAMRLNDTELEMLFNEAKKLETARFSKIEEIEEVCKGIYLLYWGSSDLMIGRLIAHINGHSKNSNLHLCNYSFFDEKELFYATIAVTDNAVFEDYLINKYPPMLKTMVKK